VFSFYLFVSRHEVHSTNTHTADEHSSASTYSSFYAQLGCFYTVVPDYMLVYGRACVRNPSIMHIYCETKLLFPRGSEGDNFLLAHYTVSSSLNPVASVEVELMPCRTQYWKYYYGFFVFPWKKTFFLFNVFLFFIKSIKLAKQLENCHDTNKATWETFSSHAEVVKNSFCPLLQAFKALILSGMLSIRVLQNVVIFSL